MIWHDRNQENIGFSRITEGAFIQEQEPSDSGYSSRGVEMMDFETILTPPKILFVAGFLFGLCAGMIGMWVWMFYKWRDEQRPVKFTVDYEKREMSVGEDRKYRAP